MEGTALQEKINPDTGEITAPAPQLSLFEGELVDEHVYKVKGFETTIYDPLKRGAMVTITVTATVTEIRAHKDKDGNLVRTHVLEVLRTSAGVDD